MISKRLKKFKEQIQLEFLKKQTVSLYRNINLFNPVPFFLQVTKTRCKNKLKYPNYTFLEHFRKNSGGEGLITAVHNSIHPVLVMLKMIWKSWWWNLKLMTLRFALSLDMVHKKEIKWRQPTS